MFRLCIKTRPLFSSFPRASLPGPPIRQKLRETSSSAKCLQPAFPENIGRERERDLHLRWQRSLCQSPPALCEPLRHLYSIRDLAPKWASWPMSFFPISLALIKPSTRVRCAPGLWCGVWSRPRTLRTAERRSNYLPRQTLVHQPPFFSGCCAQSPPPPPPKKKKQRVGLHKSKIPSGIDILKRDSLQEWNLQAKMKLSSEPHSKAPNCGDFLGSRLQLSSKNEAFNWRLWDTSPSPKSPHPPPLMNLPLYALL